MQSMDRKKEMTNNNSLLPTYRPKSQMRFKIIVQEGNQTINRYLEATPQFIDIHAEKPEEMKALFNDPKLVID